MSRIKDREERRTTIEALLLSSMIVLTLIIIAAIGLIVASKVPPQPSFTVEVIIGCLILVGIIVASAISVCGVIKIFLEIFNRYE
jgi:hypothetical protein